MTELSVVIPTFNEAPNIEALVARVAAAVRGIDADIVVIDDGADATADLARSAAEAAGIRAQIVHRDHPEGGLSGAVVAGLRIASSDRCVVLDGDLQHPPEQIPELYARLTQGDADIVIASRYVSGGEAAGLSDRTRTFVSWASTSLTRAMFPRRLANVTDPMTGFFAVDRSALSLDRLRPRGYKILLEILARHTLRTAEVPFAMAHRHGGESKASFRQGMLFLTQLAALRFGKMSAFALVGAIGALANLAIMWALTALGVPYVVAAIIGAEVTILGNFALLEYFVFRDMKGEAAGFWTRFVRSFVFNNVEAAVRIPIMAVMVEQWHIQSVLATAITLVVAFIVRFVYHSLYVYAPKKRRPVAAVAARDVDDLDDEVPEPIDAR